MILAVTGRLPALGRAELERCFGAEHITVLNEQICLLAAGITPSQKQLGSVVKTAQLIDQFPADSAADLLAHLEKALLAAASQHTGKLTVGFSAYHAERLRLQPKQLFSLKDRLKGNGVSLRIVNTNQLELNAAQVLYNQLLNKGLELIITCQGNQVFVGQTLSVQDIDAYAARDQVRPARDAKVGMLPPKLAQTMINLAQPPHGGTILDPFCGTGVVLQEAILMGYGFHGSDIDARMVEYTTTNLQWLKQSRQIRFDGIVSKLDARTGQWPLPIDGVISEVYLGTPLHKAPDQITALRLAAESEGLLEAFLSNLARQIEPGTPLCLAMPAWQTAQGMIHSPVIDQISALGYNRVSFKHVQPQELVYRRNNQYVGRELLVLTRK